MAKQVNRLTKPFSTYADGSEAALRMVEIIGEQPGPLIGITAAIHGNEYSGPQTVLELFRRLQDIPLKGRIRILPVANVPAFVANRRFTPLDSQNLNREFPGAADGTYTQQLAAAISREILDVVDIHFDLHSGGDLCTVDYVSLFPGDEGLSRVFGSKVLYRPDPTKKGTMFKGMSFAVSLEKRGIPTVGVELGGGIVDQAPYVARYVRGVTNMLKKLGVIPGEAPEPPKQIVMSEIGIVRPTQGGWIETSCPANGELVKKGTEIGQIVSPYTFEVLEKLCPPPAFEEGVVIMQHLTRNLVQPGEYGFLIANMEGTTD